LEPEIGPCTKLYSKSSPRRIAVATIQTALKQALRIFKPQQTGLRERRA
jgi:hypothetical protein